LGVDAYRFIDFLSQSGFGLWQVLPLGPTHEDNSPYQALSSHAGNPQLVDWCFAQSRQWLTQDDLALPLDAIKYRALSGFDMHASAEERAEYAEFQQQQAYWLDDYVLFMAAKKHHQGASWVDWSADLKLRDDAAMAAWRERLQNDIDAFCFEQFLFFTQWLGIKSYAEEKNIQLFGDIPIFVAHDSADVWAKQDVFLLDEAGIPTVVAGVPPDYFSETGQRWGNPLYDWDKLHEQSYGWWLDRMRTQMALFDVVRIDHFRGFEAYWEIAADEETAINGVWKQGPGADFFHALQKEYGEDLPLVAEDLGIITDEVDALRLAFKLPGMKILQFAFGGTSDNPYLPHHHERNSVVYTGTHDNDTTLGWWNSLDEGARQHVIKYLACEQADDMPWSLIRSALASVSRWAVLPMQDLLSLDGEHRMNVPGTQEDNWQWCFDWQQLDDDLPNRCHDLLQLYDRLPGAKL
jgi:4-alpha-glucanotransferase